MALYIVYKSEGGHIISAINSQVLAKLHKLEYVGDSKVG